MKNLADNAGKCISRNVANFQHNCTICYKVRHKVHVLKRFRQTLQPKYKKKENKIREDYFC